MKNPIKKTISKMWFLTKRIYYKFLRTFFCKKRVVFISFNGKQYSDNPKFISEKLHELSPKTKQVWFFVNPDKMRENIPDYIQCEKLTNRRLLRYLQTSRVWVDNDLLVYKSFITKYPKRKDQIFIQSWHGDRGLKKCFYDVKGYKPPEAAFTLQTPGFCDYLLTGSAFAEKVVRTMFRYKGKLLTCGYPRNDCLINKNEEAIKKVKQKLDISEDTKILLYAPTFKGKIGDKMTEHIDFKKIVEILEEKTKQNWIVAYRPHHIGKDTEIPSCTRFFYTNKLFEDMAEILQATDLLITDYSSCAGDFILTNKPVILYINDYDAYISSDRGLHFDIEKTPFLFAKDNEELQEIVENLTTIKAKNNCEELKSFYGCTETGHASETVVNLILENLYHKREKQ